MRIGILASNLLFRYDSGIGKYVTSLVREMGSLSSHEFHVFSSPVGREIEGVKIHERRFQSGLPSLLLNRVYRELGDMDLVHAPKFVLRAEGDYAKVITVHDVYYMEAREMFPAATVKYWDRYLPKSVEEADAVIVPSRSTRDDVLRNFSCPGSKVHVVPHGVSRSYFEPDGEGGMPPDLPPGYLLCVSPISPRKNIPALLDAYSLLDTDLPLVIAGPRAFKWKEACRKMGSTPGVIHLEQVPEGQMPALYHGAALFVYPSVYEGFGLPLLEAMASSTPVIACSNSSVPELVGDAALLLEDSGDARALARAMSSVLEDPSRMKEMARAGRQRAEKYTWKRCAKETLEIYGKAKG